MTTGALVSKPTFDPNLLTGHRQSDVLTNYEELLTASGQPLQNRGLGGNMNPPGSTFKLVVTAAALASGEYTPESTLPNPRSYTLPGTSTTITNSEGGACGGGKTVSIATALRIAASLGSSARPMAATRSRRISAESQCRRLDSSELGRMVMSSNWPGTELNVPEAGAGGQFGAERKKLRTDRLSGRSRGRRGRTEGKSSARV